MWTGLSQTIIMNRSSSVLRDQISWGSDWEWWRTVTKSFKSPWFPSLNISSFIAETRAVQPQVQPYSHYSLGNLKSCTAVSGLRSHVHVVTLVWWVVNVIHLKHKDLGHLKSPLSIQNIIFYVLYIYVFFLSSRPLREICWSCSFSYCR